MRVPLALVSAGAAFAQVYVDKLPPEYAAIRYFERPLTDRASRLAHELESGGTRLTSGADSSGYLASLLEHLDVAVDSQALVSSKTSFQAANVSPRNPCRDLLQRRCSCRFCARRAGDRRGGHRSGCRSGLLPARGFALCEVGRNHSVLASLAFTLAPCCSGAFIKSR
jgi:hypothetical protein